MTHPPIGKLVMATVDGTKAVVYFSLSTDEKGDWRREWCWRYGPKEATPNAVIPKDAKVVITGEVPSLGTALAVTLSRHE